MQDQYATNMNGVVKVYLLTGKMHRMQYRMLKWAAKQYTV